MNYFNPMQQNMMMAMQQAFTKPNIAPTPLGTTMTPSPNFMAPAQQTNINPQQFMAVARSLDNNSIQQLINMAKQKGISDTDIQTGLNFINSIRGN